MGHRLTKIYTRTGDSGTTGLGNGSRVDKDSPRMEAIGATDELNSLIGLVLAHECPKTVGDRLLEIQHDLFDLGGELSVPGRTVVTDAQVRSLEAGLDELNEELPYLKEFILPGGGPAAATCHLARAVCRRAERTVVSLARLEDINPEVQRYLNRLSDLLFVVARVLARHEGGGEVLWRR